MISSINIRSHTETNKEKNMYTLIIWFFMNLAQSNCTNFDYNYPEVEKLIQNPELLKNTKPTGGLENSPNPYKDDIEDLNNIRKNGYQYKCSRIHVDYSKRHGWSISNGIILKDIKNDDEVVFSFDYNLFTNTWQLFTVCNRTRIFRDPCTIIVK